MAQVKIVKSELIHNLQFEIMYNGLTYSIQNDTLNFQTGRHYSPLELSQGNKLACEAIMLEADKLKSVNPNGYINALIADSKYSKQGFFNNLERINLCAYWNPEKYFKIAVAGSDLECLKIFVSNKDQALKMAKHYARINGFLESGAVVYDRGLMVDYIKPHFIESEKRRASKVLMCSSMKRELFSLQDEEAKTFEESNFFKWLDDNKVKDHNSIITRGQYLKSIGFNMALHKLSEKALNSLKHTLDYHFNLRVKPALGLGGWK